MNFDDIKLSTMSPGTYTIRAIFDGDETYNPKTVEFILVVGERPEDTHIVIPLDEEGEKQYIELSFTESVVTIEEDLTTNKYQLQMPNNPKNVSLVWRCDNDNVLFDLENNSIILPNIGVYTIYAVFAGDDDYYPSTASYTLRLTDDEGNTERAQRHYNFYFDEYETTIYERDDHLYTLPTVKSKREDDIPQSMLDLCTWTIDETTVPYSNGYSMQIDELGTYTLTFSFAGNEDWLPQTLEYKITIKEKENPELSFDNLYLVLQRNVEGKYIMQPLNNPHNLSPIKWAVSSTQESMIRLDPDQKICYVSTGQGQYPIVAIFEGNDIYKRQQVVYNLRIISSQEDAELSFEYEYMEFESNTPIDNDGDRYPLQRLHNPAGLPVTWSIDTLSATLDIDDNREYNQVVFFHTVRNAVISVDFAGDDYYTPMHAQYTITYINWEERITPALSFDNPVETFQTNMSQEYALQMPNNPLSLPLEWSITHSDHASVDADARKVYIEEFNFYTVTASFAGNDEYKPVSASYEIHLGKEEATIWFDHPIDTIWSFPDGYSYVLQIQPALTSPEGLPVKYYSNSTDCVVDEKNMVLIVRKRGTYTIQGLFEGDYIYDPCSALYYVRATDEKDPELPDTKIDIDFSFENATVNIQYIQGTDYYELQQPYNPYNVEFDWSVVSTDGNPCAVSGNYLLCWSTGVYQITARFAGNDYYNPASATYTIVMYEESVEKQDIDLAFFDYNVRDYVHDDGMYEYQEAYWKLTSEDESHWRPARDLLDIVYSITPSGEIRTYPTNVAYGQAYIEAGQGIYKIRAEFAGNGLYNPAWTEYYLNIGNYVEPKVDPQISFTNSTVTITQVNTNLYELQLANNPYGVEIEYQVSGEGNYIQSNDTIVIPNVGTYTITATSIETERYLPSTISYTITIEERVYTRQHVTISAYCGLEDYYIDKYEYWSDIHNPHDLSMFTVEVRRESDDEIINVPLVVTVSAPNMVLSEAIYDYAPDSINYRQLVETRNPMIYVQDEMTEGQCWVTVSWQFVGNNEYYPSEVASCDILLKDVVGSLSFAESEIEYENKNANNIYDLQTPTIEGDVVVISRTSTFKGVTHDISANQSTISINDYGKCIISYRWHPKNDNTTYTSQYNIVVGGIVNIECYSSTYSETMHQFKLNFDADYLDSKEITLEADIVAHNVKEYSDESCQAEYWIVDLDSTTITEDIESDGTFTYPHKRAATFNGQFDHWVWITSEYIEYTIRAKRGGTVVATCTGIMYNDLYGGTSQHDLWFWFAANNNTPNDNYYIDVRMSDNTQFQFDMTNNPVNYTPSNWTIGTHTTISNNSTQIYLKNLNNRNITITASDALLQDANSKVIYIGGSKRNEYLNKFNVPDGFVVRIDDLYN